MQSEQRTLPPHYTVESYLFSIVVKILFAMELAIVTPLRQVSSPINPSDLILISILSALSKWFEIIMDQQVSYFIERNNLLSSL